MHRPRIAILLAVALSCLILTHPASAYRRGRYRGRNNAARIAALKVQANANVAAAKQVLGAASAAGAQAQGKIADAQATSKGASDQGKEAKDHLIGGHARLKEIEARIADSQLKGSEFNQALDALEDARDDMTELREKIVRSPEYQRRYDLALASDNRADETTKVKQELLEDNSDYALAVAGYEQARVKFNNLFHKLLEEDPEWQAAVEDLRKARVSSGEAQGKMTSAGLTKMNAKQHLKQAAAVASEAEAVIATNQAVLNALPGSRKPACAEAAAVEGKHEEVTPGKADATATACAAPSSAEQGASHRPNRLTFVG